MQRHPSSHGMTVLITGASAGIGLASAQLFAARGARVFGTSRSEHADAPGIEMLRLDIRSDDSVRSCVEHVLDRCGHIDVLINNAGRIHQGFAEETTVAEAQALFDTNFFGTQRMTSAVLPGMRARGHGRIINIGSLAAWVGEPGEGAYAASKAAVARYTEALRHEVWHLGIRTVLVEPGAYRTDVLRRPSTSAARIPDYDGPRESARDVLHQSMRSGDDPADVAHLLWRVATTPGPRGRYGIGSGGSWIPKAKVLLPQRVFETILRHGYHLPR